jgi:hypothetical protein
MQYTLEHRIEAFVRLGQRFAAIGAGEGPEYAVAVIEKARAHNAWFTEENIRQSFAALGEMLEETSLRTWLSTYPFLLSADPEAPSKTVAVIMAGNIPMVGFHDLLCVLLGGHKALVKLSSDDAILMPAVVYMLAEIDKELASRVEFAQGKLHSFDAVIATGSNNTSRYFEYYFGKYPNIIRKGRSSIALLQGDEDEAELAGLAKDVFSYFGMGCRNVTKVYVPQSFDLNRLFGAFYPYAWIINHNKYANNYDYHRALWLLNGDDLLENGFLLMKEDKALVSPVGSLFYERYADKGVLLEQLALRSEEIQCTVGRGMLPFGKAQVPGVSDYADGVDTIRFLAAL